MNRYDILIGRELESERPRVDVLVLPEPQWNPLYEYIEDGLSISFPAFAGIPTQEQSTAILEAILNPMIERCMKRFKDEWEFDRLIISSKIIDKLYIKCIFKKAKQNALSSASTLGSGEQRAGIYEHPYNWAETLRDLWHPSPAMSASRNNQP